jgi:hypothetical protein
MTYGRCPDQALSRLRGQYPPESKASFKGSLAHRVFARHLTKGAIVPADFDRVCKEEIGSGMNPKLTSLGLRPSQLSAMIREVGDLYDKFKVLSGEGFRDSEVFLEVEPQPDLILRGSIDAVFDEEDDVRLVDWKTGGLYETDQQLGFYAMLWALDRGRLPRTVEAVSIGSGERLRAHPTEGEITTIARNVANLVADVRAAFALDRSRIERVAGPWCRFCVQLNVCDEGMAAVKISGAG